MRIARLSTMGIGLPSLCKKISMIYYAQIEILRVVCILFFLEKPIDRGYLGETLE